MSVCLQLSSALFVYESLLIDIFETLCLRVSAHSYLWNSLAVFFWADRVDSGLLDAYSNKNAGRVDRSADTDSHYNNLKASLHFSRVWIELALPKSGRGNPVKITPRVEICLAESTLPAQKNRPFVYESLLAVILETHCLPVAVHSYLWNSL